jgi:predicted peptidase
MLTDFRPSSFSPQSLANGTPGWQTAGGQAALAALDQTIYEFHGDSSRVYLTGYSAGGNGTWYLASHHPERFAALVVISAFVSEFRGKTSGASIRRLHQSLHPIHSSMWQGRYRLYLSGSSTAMQTKQCLWRNRENMMKALKATGADVQYTELSGVEHNAWDAAYDRADLIQWMLKQSRK